MLMKGEGTMCLADDQLSARVSSHESVVLIEFNGLRAIMSQFTDISVCGGGNLEILST